jgi:hypothetical protein
MVGSAVMPLDGPAAYVGTGMRPSRGVCCRAASIAAMSRGLAAGVPAPVRGVPVGCRLAGGGSFGRGGNISAAAVAARLAAVIMASRPIASSATAWMASCRARSSPGVAASAIVK